MKKQKQAILVGGVSGSGKTLLTQKLGERFCCFVKREEPVMAEIGKQRGISWRELFDYYDELIDETAGKIASDFSHDPAPVMLVDCHYAIKLKRMLALKLEGELVRTKEPYIQAIDDRVIKRLRQDFPTRFVFLEVEPQIAFNRVRRRLKDAADRSYTLKELRDHQDAERKFFNKILRKFNVLPNDFLLLSNNGQIEEVVGRVVKFINL